MRVRAALLALALAAGGAPAAGQEADAQTAQPPAPPETETQLGDSLALTIEFPGESPLGRPVPFVIRLENVGQAAVTLNVGAPPRTHDVRVLDFREREIWRLQANIAPPRFEPRTLMPGQALVYGAEWPQITATDMMVGRGDYKVRGIIFSEGGDFTSATRAFLIR